MKTRPIPVALGIAALAATATLIQSRAIANLKSDNRQWAVKIESLRAERESAANQIQEMSNRQAKASKEAQSLGNALDRLVQGIKKARADAMEQLVAWKDNIDYVDIPKQFLQSLHISAYERDEYGDYHISDNVAALLGMNAQERARVQDTLSQARNRYFNKEKELLQTSTEADPNNKSTDDWKNRVTYSLPAYARESQEFQAAYKADLQSLLGDTRTSLLLAYAKFGGRGGAAEYFDFTEMGLHDRSVTVGLDPKDPVASQWHFVDWAKDNYTISGGMGIGDQPSDIPAGWRHLLSTNMFSVGGQ